MNGPWLVWKILGLVLIVLLISERFLRTAHRKPTAYESIAKGREQYARFKDGYRLLQWILILALITVLVHDRFLSPTYQSMSQEREALAQRAVADVLQVAVVWPRGQAGFLNGARMAAGEINQLGGVNLVRSDGRGYQRRLRLWEIDEPTERQPSPAIARRIAFDSSIVATVGYATDEALPASIVHNASGVLFIVPNSTNRAVTMHDFEFVFRIAPRDDQIARAMVQVVPHIAGRKRIRLALLHPRLLASQSGRKEVNMLTQQVETLIRDHGANIDFEVVIAQEYERDQQDFRDVIEPLLESREEFNVVLIADVSPDAEILRRELRTGLAAIGIDALDETPILDFDELNWAREKGYYFRFTPNQADDFFEVAARLVLEQTRQPAAVLIARDDRFSRDQFGRRLGARLESQIINSDSQLHRLDLIMSRSYDPRGRDFAPLVAEVLQRSVDFVFIADNGESTLELIEQLRTAGAEQPIICGFGLETLLLCDSNPRLGKTYVASTFNQQSDSPEVQSFLQKYRAKHPGTNDEAYAAYGYFSIQLVKEALERAGSASPQKIADALGLFVEPDGVLGKNQFFSEGDLQGLRFVFKHVGPDRQVKIIPLPPQATARRIPYRRPNSMYGGG